MVAQDKVAIDIYRHSESSGQLESLSYGDTVTFESVHFEAAAEMFYEDVLGSLR